MVLSPHFSLAPFLCVCGICEHMCAGMHALVQTQTSKEDSGILPIIFHLFTFEQVVSLTMEPGWQPVFSRLPSRTQRLQAYEASLNFLVWVLRI